MIQSNIPYCNGHVYFSFEKNSKNWIHFFGKKIPEWFLVHNFNCQGYGVAEFYVFCLKSQIFSSAVIKLKINTE